MKARVVGALVMGIAIGASVTFAVAATIDNGSTKTPKPAAAATVQVEAATATQTHQNHGLPGHNKDEVAEQVPDKPLDAATRTQLAAQLTEARVVALKYPIVADAEKAGFYRAGQFAPGVGAHYISPVPSIGAFDLDHPLAYIYDGVSPTSRLVGIMYYSFASGAPDGFAGPNDHWHRHDNVCIKPGPRGLDVPLPADTDVTPEQCTKVGGSLLGKTAWMLHAWVVPGSESPQGVFSHSNPNLLCADGTDKTDSVGFCAGT
jgi:hypothetical protein